MRVAVRIAAAGDAVALAGLRWRAEQGDPAGTDRAGKDRAGFVEFFAAWVTEHLSTHVPFLAEVDDQVVGMAWLMMADRPPGAARRHRRAGDVQTVYVVPELRDRGVGAALLDAVLTEARRLELEHVTVHANGRAMTLYQRAGFQHHQHWLRWKPA